MLLLTLLLQVFLLLLPLGVLASEEAVEGGADPSSPEATESSDGLDQITKPLLLL